MLRSVGFGVRSPGPAVGWLCAGPGRSTAAKLAVAGQPVARDCWPGFAVLSPVAPERWLPVPVGGRGLS